MADRSPAALVSARPLSQLHRRECRVLSHWLVGREPSEYVIACYEAGVSSEAYREGLRSRAVDRVLGAFVRSGWLGAALADAYARVFSAAGELRRKQVLLVSILESAHPSDQAFEPPRTGVAGALAALILVVSGFVLRLVVAVPVIGIVHLVTLAARPAGR